MTGVLDTLRYVKGDPVARPCEEIVRDNGYNEAYFNGELPKEDIEKFTQGLVKHLPEEHKRLGELIDRLEQLELRYEAGILSDESREFDELFVEFSLELGIC